MLSATRQLRLKGLLLLLSSTRTGRVLHQAGSQAGAEEIFLNNSFALLNIWLRKLMCSLRSRLYALLLRWSELCIAWVVMIQWPGPGSNTASDVTTTRGSCYSVTQSPALLTEGSRCFLTSSDTLLLPAHISSGNHSGAGVRQLFIPAVIG